MRLPGGPIKIRHVLELRNQSYAEVPKMLGMRLGGTARSFALILPS